MKEEHLLLDMAQSYLRSGDKEKALVIYFQYLRKVPKDADVCFQVAKLLSCDDSETAIMYLKRAAALGSYDAIKQLRTINNRKEEEQ